MGYKDKLADIQKQQQSYSVLGQILGRRGGDGAMAANLGINNLQDSANDIVDQENKRRATAQKIAAKAQAKKNAEEASAIRTKFGAENQQNSPVGPNLAQYATKQPVVPKPSFADGLAPSNPSYGSELEKPVDWTKVPYQTNNREPNSWLQGLPQRQQPTPGTSTPLNNPDGSQTTERSITIQDSRLNGGRPTNIPTVWGGQVVSNQQATENAVRSGVQFPGFNSIPEAVSSARQRSTDIGNGQPSIGGATVPPPLETYVEDASPFRNAAVAGNQQFGGKPGLGSLTDAPTGNYATGGGSPKGEIDNSSRATFVVTAYPYMLEAANGDPHLAELMLAKAISENGDVGKGGGFIGNNFSGIKGTGSAGSFTSNTWEQVNGQRVPQKATFAAFNTPQEGFKAFMNFLENNSRYAGALARYRATGDSDALFTDINTAGYATDPNWANTVRNIRDRQVRPLLR